MPLGSRRQAEPEPLSLQFPMARALEKLAGSLPSFICLALPGSQWPQGGEGGGNGKMR